MINRQTAGLPEDDTDNELTQKLGVKGSFQQPLLSTMLRLTEWCCTMHLSFWCVSLAPLAEAQATSLETSRVAGVSVTMCPLLQKRRLKCKSQCQDEKQRRPAAAPILTLPGSSLDPFLEAA